MATVNDSYIIELERQRAELEGLLRDKGVDIADDETLNTLIPKVSKIGYNDVMRSIFDGTIEEFVDDKITQIKLYAFHSCKNLRKVIVPNVSTVYGQAFSGCSALVEVDLSGVVSLSGMNTSIFQNCTSLTEIALDNMPEFVNAAGSAYNGCTALKRISHLNAKTYNPTSSTFASCGSLDTFVFGQDCTLSSVTVVSGIPKVKTGECFFYFPKSLVEKKKTDTNWSTFADLIRAIEDYPEVLEWAVKNGYVSEV